MEGTKIIMVGCPSLAKGGGLENRWVSKATGVQIPPPPPLNFERIKNESYRKRI